MGGYLPNFAHELVAQVGLPPPVLFLTPQALWSQGEKGAQSACGEETPDPGAVDAGPWESWE